MHLGFSEDGEDGAGLEDIDTIKSKLATLLLSLLEGETDMESINRMSLSLDFTIMKERLLYVFTTFARKLLNAPNKPVEKISLNVLTQYLERDSFEDNVAEAFEIYTLLNTLADSSLEARK